LRIRHPRQRNRRPRHRTDYSKLHAALLRADFTRLAPAMPILLLRSSPYCENFFSRAAPPSRSVPVSAAYTDSRRVQCATTLPPQGAAVLT
jgi:hypothetical protein